MLLIGLLASMPVFAVRRRGRAVDPDVARRAASRLLGVWVRDWMVWLLAAGGLADILDGRVARARRLASRRGAFLDSTLDRFGETATFVGLAWRLAAVPWQSATVALALGGSLLVSYARARGEALGATMHGGLMQRPERLVVLIAGALVESAASGRPGWSSGAALTVAVALLAIGTVGTALYRTAVVARLLADADARETER
jgi:phosphatidylglycerophosphate synthase